MQEVAKSTVRRLKDSRWQEIFKGSGIELCSDTLDTTPSVAWDNVTSIENFSKGDANYLSTYYDRDRFDFLHASTLLASMRNPVEALRDWLKVIRPGGYAIVTVPDFYLYECGKWPSPWSSTHVSTWSMIRPDTGCEYHQYVTENWLKDNNLKAKWNIKPTLVDNNYDYTLLDVDQTEDASKLVECWIEFVIEKE